MFADFFRRRIGCLFLFALLGAGGVFAEAPKIEIQAPSTPLSVGDPLKVQVRASGGEDGLWGELKADVPEDGDWALLEGPTAVAGASSPAWELSLAPLKVGKLDLPPLSIRWRKGEAQPLEITPAETPEITVASVIPPGDQKGPAALKDPIGVQGFPWEWVLPIAVLLLLILGLALLLRSLRRRKKLRDESAPALPPWEEFRRAMREVEGRIGKDAADAVCDRMAFILRKYLERRSDHPAAEMTSSELRFLARELQWPSEAQIDLQKILLLFDSVRFARKAVSEAALREAGEKARGIARLLEDHYLPAEVEDAA